MDATDEMRTLVARLNEAADAYYSGRGEIMTDFEWDAMFDRLKALEAQTGVVLPDSPTANVSSGSVAGEKEAHEFAALSLAKTKSVAEVAKWADSRPIWLSWKLDGLTLVATYDGGRLAKVVTRGDGHIGTNITHLAKAVRGIPEKIAETGHLVVRGEAVISYADFEAFREVSQEDYANPRNLASGSLTLKDPAEVAERHIQFIPFSPVHISHEIVSWGERMNFLSSLGFNCVERELIPAPSPDAIGAAISRWTDKVTNGDCPFPVDGLVVCYDDTEYAKTGSVTGHHATRAGLAFKWADETAATALDHVEWSCAVASIAPVAVFEPVQLEGTTVKRASLCNVSECERLGIGGKGTRLEVIKANKIIPKVVSVTEKIGDFAIPSACPVCGAPTEIRTSASLTKTLRCTNAECPARELRKFMRFVSKDGMDIDGLAGETIAKFVNCGWIKSFADIYRLPDHADEIAAMEGFGRKSADNITAAIADAKRRSAVNFLVSLSIPLCGREVARRLLAAHDSLAALIDAAERGASFAHIDGIGDVKSDSFVAYFASDRHRSAVHELLSIVEIEEFAGGNSTGKCAGLTFVITGDVHIWANRAELKSYIESQGGKVASSVSAKTSFLINNDIASTSSKNKKAQSLGIPIISEDDFAARFSDQYQ